MNVITPANASIFPEYIIPNIHPLVSDPEVSVRSLYAQCIVHLADVAVRYLEMGQALKAHGTFKVTADAVEYDEAQFEVSPPTQGFISPDSILLGAVRRSIARLTECDPRASHYTTRRPFQCREACGSARCLIYVHFSRATAYERYLTKPHDHVPERPGLAYSLRFLPRDSGRGSVCGWKESGRIYIASNDSGSVRLGNSPFIPYTATKPTSDVEECVVARVLAALTSLCELGLFQKMRIWELMSANLGFLYHPNSWIRQGTFQPRSLCRGLHFPYQVRRHLSPQQHSTFHRAMSGASSTLPSDIFFDPMCAALTNLAF